MTVPTDASTLLLTVSVLVLVSYEQVRVPERASVPKQLGDEIMCTKDEELGFQ